MVGVAAQPAEGNSDHQQMLAKLKITSPLRPGPAGRLNADGTSSAQLRREQGHCRLAGATAAGDERWPQDHNADHVGRAPQGAVRDFRPGVLWSPAGSGEVLNDLLFRRKKPFALIDVNARRFGRAKLNRIWMDLEREVALCSMPLDRRV